MASFVFFGTPYVARDTLAALVAHGFSPVAVVTSPDAPKGRGMELAPSETKTWAEVQGFPVLAPEKLDTATQEEIARYGADYAVVVAYGKIFPEALLNLFPKGVINVHYSLLPAYRGAAPVETALLHSDTKTGVTIQRMQKELDAGDIIAQESVDILPTETTRELRPRLIQLGADLLIRTLPDYLSGVLTPRPQDAAQATFARKISKEDGELSLSGDAQKNWNTYRAYAESPGTYFFAEKNGTRMRIKIKTATFENGAFMPLRVVPEGKKEMNWADFIRQ